MSIRLRLFASALCALTVAGTASGAKPRVARFSALDGVKLEGRVYGAGTFGVVLTHQLQSDASEWDRFARKLSARGYLVVAVNVRGTCPGRGFGCSRGSFDPEEIWRDIGGAARFLHAKGARSVALVGASMGGEASLVAAARARARIAGVVSLSGSEGFAGPLDPDEERRLVRGIKVPKLFVAGAGDAAAAQAANDYEAMSLPPKKRLIVPSTAHGVHLFDDPQVGTRVTTTLLAFLNALRR